MLGRDALRFVLLCFVVGLCPIVMGCLVARVFVLRCVVSSCVVLYYAGPCCVVLCSLVWLCIRCVVKRAM